MNVLLRERLKNYVGRFKLLNRAVEFFLRRRYDLKFLLKAIEYASYDFCVELRHMKMRRESKNYWKLSSELIFWYHKIEKGLCLPEPHRFFGMEAVYTTCRLMREWEESGFDMSSPIYSSAIESLIAYEIRLSETPPPAAIKEAYLKNIHERIQSGNRNRDLSTPFTSPQPPFQATDILASLCLSRRSVRSFSKRSVEYSLIERAVSIAQLSPSACNRQPWHVHLYQDGEKIEKILKLQKGSAGFMHTIPMLGVITADMNSFQDLSERLEPALDAGLFLMTFLLALQAEGLSTCCLNWCVSPSTDKQGHKIGNIANNEKIVACLAIGYAEEHAKVPRSARRLLAEVILRH